ncbi:hypothetical protein [Puia dinghuensis]|uniref:Peptidase S74 domain-containing protein n=1 Tax=Puia dinghuensis TaxID=1792502 RepID=A0A8J2UHP1_9BACT|nr:hypothetical protein [Puia dinghuensis]GGB17641.1 hypothetical protein GCM10011511_46810 [Puia dinghuensis]
MRPSSVKLILLCIATNCLLFSISGLGQNGGNNFPSIGNVTVGTSSSPNTLTVNGTLITNGTITQSGGTPSSSTGFSTYMVTNTNIPGSSVNMNPGLLVYGDRWFDYGIDLGYNYACSRYRTRIFSPMAADVALSYINETGTIPTSHSQFSDGLVMLGGSGNILIGKLTQTNSVYKLDVGGQARANEMTVNTTGADFVFDPGYALPLLSEVAAYVKAHHHLPQVEPAAEMEKNGLDLGNNQIKLLQKVEELTLYAIKADEQIKQLQETNAKQANILQEEQRMLEEQRKLLLKLQARLDSKQ